MITGVLLAVLVVGGTGAFIGLFLGVAAIKFKVDVDEKEEAVLASLPGNNCGGLRLPGMQRFSGSHCQRGGAGKCLSRRR